MIHLGAAIPNLTFSADAHYHHLEDDVVEGGKFEYQDGSIRVPEAPGLGVRLDREKLELYRELYKELGGYPYDRDPSGLDLYPLVPKQRFADPQVSLRPSLSTT
jgi:glucarate dehydratase